MEKKTNSEPGKTRLFKGLQDYSAWTPGEAAKNAETRAATFGFIAALLNQTPDADLILGLRTTDFNTFIDSIPDHDTPSNIKQGLTELSEFTQETTKMPASETALMLAKDWTRLFRGVSPGYGPAPPYEGLYMSNDELGLDIIQAVNHWYLENAVGVDSDHPDRPDYLGLELDFVRHLSELEARAWEEGDEKVATDYFQRRALFITEHIAPWVSRFCKEAKPYAKTGFYRGLIKIIQGAIAPTGEKGDDGRTQTPIPS